MSNPIALAAITSENQSRRSALLASVNFPEWASLSFHFQLLYLFQPLIEPGQHPTAIGPQSFLVTGLHGKYLAEDLLAQL